MKKTLLLILLTANLSLSSQIKSEKYTIGENYKIEGYHKLADETIFFVERGNKKTKPGTKLFVLDKNKNIKTHSTYSDRFWANDFKLHSPKGENFLLPINDKYYLAKNEIKKEWTNSNDYNFDGEIWHDLSDYDSRVVHHDRLVFLTETKLVSLGVKDPKKTKLNNVYLFQKDFETMSEKYNKLAIPNNRSLDTYTTKLLFYNDEKFILAYLEKRKIYEKERNYTIAEYDYTGNIINKFEIGIKINEKNKKISLLNLEEYTFGVYQPTDIYGRSTSIISYSMPSLNSYGSIKYDENENSFYVYTPIRTLKKDSGLQICKFTNSGKVIWDKEITFKKSNFKWINSANRYIETNLNKNFLGILLYSTKGKDYFDIALVNKQTGDVINEINYRKDYRFYKTSNKYNGFYSDYIIKNKDYKNLVLDKETLMAALYDKKVNDFLVKLNAKGEKVLLKGWFSGNSLLLLKSPKKGKTLEFVTFNFANVQY